MKTKIYLLAFAGCLFFASCAEDSLDSKSIFDTDIPEKTSFDHWLDDNFADPYNIEVVYRTDAMEIPFTNTFIPAKLENSKKMAFIIKHMFIGSYNEIANEGSDFLKKYAPRFFVFVGDMDGARGTAGGGIRVVLYNLNYIDYTSEQLATTYFKTIHHEFQHILNQKNDYPAEMDQISAGLYVTGDYTSIALTDALAAGFISPYAQSEVGEDVAETFAWYVVLSSEQWENRLSLGGSGADIIRRKLDIIKEYMMTTYNIDMDELRDVNVRRMSELSLFDLDNLPF